MTCSILNRLSEDGVSETISAVLLVGLTVIGVAIISVILFSQPLAESLPAVDIIVSNTSSTILFQHHGGDSLGRDDFTIFVNGEVVEPDNLRIDYTGDKKWPWSVGETLNYSYTGITKLSEDVRMVYGKDGSGSIIRPTFVDDAGNDDYSGSVPPSSGEPSIVLISTMDNIKIVEGKEFKFKIKSQGSTIKINRDPFELNLATGEKISIITGPVAQDNFISITGDGNSFFSLRFENVSVSINDVLIDNGDLIDIESGWIPKYEILTSTLSFKVKNPYKLYINKKLDPRELGTITLENVRPTDSGMFVINPLTPEENTEFIILAKAGGIP